jgi:hypothetical protein
LTLSSAFTTPSRLSQKASSYTVSVAGETRSCEAGRGRAAAHPAVAQAKARSARGGEGVHGSYSALAQARGRDALIPRSRSRERMLAVPPAKRRRGMLPLRAHAQDTGDSKQRGRSTLGREERRSALGRRSEGQRGVCWAERSGKGVLQAEERRRSALGRGVEGMH